MTRTTLVTQLTRSQSAIIGLVAFVATASLLAVASAWTAPSANPPSGNMSPPITTGSVTQTKAGNITVNGMAIFGNTLIQASGPSNGYLSFGTTAGTSSYGIRSRNGLIEFKNQGGHWLSLASTTANYVNTGQWQAGPSNSIYYTGGNVGINTTAPNAPLEVNGYVKMTGQSAEPQSCTAAHKGMMAMTNNASLCICNGSSWVTESNGGTCAWNVVPGSQDFSSSGTFVVPAYNTLTVYVAGGGGGGGSGYYSGSVAGAAGGASSFNGTIFANGGGGGGAGGMLAGSYGGAGGTASGGNVSNTPGNAGTSACNATTGGSSPAGGAGGWTGPTYSHGTAGGAPGGGGAAGCNNLGYGGGGGGGGLAVHTYTAGQLSGNITVVVGSGGAGAQWSYYGGNGGNGGVYIEWN